MSDCALPQKDAPKAGHNTSAPLVVPAHQGGVSAHPPTQDHRNPAQQTTKQSNELTECQATTTR